MGANSSSSRPEEPYESPITRPKLEDIPEACIALVLSYLDPLQICKLARLNRAFRAASSADFIWETKLPPNYPYILDKVGNDGDIKRGKKDIFATLSRPFSFDDGNKEMWIDKRTGGICVSISSKAMSITGIDDRRYWNQIITDESRFQTIAYLQQIWWLEVDGDLEFQFPAGRYSMFFRLQLGKVTKRHGRRASNSDNIHGWDIKPVEFQLTTQDGQHAVSQKTLDNVGTWVNYHVGDFVVGKNNVSTKIKFSLTQIDCTHTKGGLSVDSVLICPSNIEKEHL
ncbi:hypothetical protein Leryth_013445 [Lithospermum erythrorhizon]|nr:hypothetical protein Leryth_013445 [Lithospermum erythrorhizon]